MMRNWCPKPSSSTRISPLMSIIVPPGKSYSPTLTPGHEQHSASKWRGTHEQPKGGIAQTNPIPKRTLTLPGGMKIFCNSSIQDFLRNYDYPPIDGKEKYLILGDSIIKRVGNINNTIVVSYPGFSLSKITTLINFGKVPEIIGKTIIMLHFGTNDITSLDEDDMLFQTWSLVKAVRSQNGLCKIVVSHIIPRFVDFATTDPIAKKYNKQIARNYKWCIETVPTYSTFLHKSKPIKGLYKKEDLLHPSPKGDRLLRSMLANHMAKIRKRLNYKRTNRSSRKTVIRRSLSSRTRRLDRRSGPMKPVQKY